MTARSLIKDLDNYLTTENLYLLPRDQNDAVTQSIRNEWRDKIATVLNTDFKHLLKSDIVETVQKSSILTIEDPDEQYATIWKSFIDVRDGEEQLAVVVKFIVNHDFAFIYLGASHTHLDIYGGSSVALKNLFKCLKQNEKIGSFQYTSFYQLFTEGLLIRRKGISTWFRKWINI